MNSFNTSGSLASMPQSGILGQNSNLFQQPKSNVGAGLSVTPASNSFIRTTNPLAGTNQPNTLPTTPGILPMPKPPAPTTAVKKTTNPDGSSTEYHKPEAPVTPPVDPNAPASTTAPGTNGNNGTNFQQNLGNVQTASNQGNSANENTAYNQALQKSILLNAGAQNVQNAGLGGSTNTLNETSTNALGTDYANLFRPQTTANLAGEKGIINPELNQALTAESGIMQGVLPEQQLATNGAENVASLTQPTQIAASNTLVNPATGQATYGLGSTNGNGSNAYQNFSNLQFNTSTGQTLSKQANDLQTAADQTTQNFNTLSQAATGINLSQFPSINAASQFLQSQTGGAGKVSALNEAYNALQTSMANIISSGGSGLTPTQITNLTNGQNISSLSPAQLLTLYNTVQQTMATKINTTQQQALNAEKSGTNFNNGSSATDNGTSTISAGGDTFSVGADGKYY